MAKCGMPTASSTEKIRTTPGCSSPGGGFDLALEAFAATREVESLGPNDFDSHVAAEPFLTSEIDDAHAAAAEAAAELELAETVGHVERRLVLEQAVLPQRVHPFANLDRMVRVSRTDLVDDRATFGVDPQEAALDELLQVGFAVGLALHAGARL